MTHIGSGPHCTCDSARVSELEGALRRVERFGSDLLPDQNDDLSRIGRTILALADAQNAQSSVENVKE